MTPTQIELVQTSFAKVSPNAETVADLFYSKLFSLNPDFRPLFKGDMKDQGRKLMAMLGTVVNNLSDLSSVLPAAESMAERHVGYGVKPHDYEVVGEALLLTLNLGLGEEFTPDVRDAWASAYGTLSDFMIERAYGAQA